MFNKICYLICFMAINLRIDFIKISRKKLTFVFFLSKLVCIGCFVKQVTLTKSQKNVAHCTIILLNLKIKNVKIHGQIN